jgi:hypothetical protein
LTELYLSFKQLAMKRREQLLSLVGDYHRSGMTQKEFCRDAGIGPAKLNYWIAKSREGSEPSGFVALRAACRKEITLEYPSGVKITLEASDLSLVSRLVKL